MSRNVSMNPNDINYDKQVKWADQAQRERMSLCGELGVEKSTSIRKAAQEVAKKLKNYENAAIEKD